MQLADYHNIHQGERIIVCGLGPSLSLFAPKYRKGIVTIGLNAIDRHFAPTYCLCVDLMREEQAVVLENSGAKTVFLAPSTNLRHPRAVPITLDMLLSDDDLAAFPMKVETPALAGVLLAAYMGARTIGLIGIDFYTDAATKVQMEQRHVPANRNARIPRLIPLLQESRQLAWDTSPPRS